MKNSFVITVLVSIVLSYSHIYSQGIFLDKGEFGVFGNGGYTSLESGNATSFGVGVALGGVLEFGFSTTNSKIKLSSYGLGNEIDVNSKTVSIGAVLLKRKAQLEANFGFTTSDEVSNSFESSDVLLLGFSVGSEFLLHEKLSWYPIFSFAIGIPTEENSGNPITALGLSAPILIAKHVYLGPTFALSEGNFSWGVTGGIIISFDIEDGDW